MIHAKGIFSLTGMIQLIIFG